MPPLDVLDRRWPLLGGFCGAFPFPYLYYTRLIPERQAKNAKNMPQIGVKVASQGVFGTVWSGTAAKSTKIRCFLMEMGWNWSFWCKNRPKFMVLKVFWSGNFGRWNVELPKRWAEGKCLIWDADWDKGWLGKMRARNESRELEWTTYLNSKE